MPRADDNILKAIVKNYALEDATDEYIEQIGY